LAVHQTGRFFYVYDIVGGALVESYTRETVIDLQTIGLTDLDGDGQQDMIVSSESLGVAIHYRDANGRFGWSARP
jgi:hypothetical protein